MTSGLSLRPLPSFAGRPGPLLLVIADGVGVAPPGPSNAVTEADTPVLDALCVDLVEAALSEAKAGIEFDDKH